MSGFRPRFFVRQEGTLSEGDSLFEPGGEFALGAEDSHHASRVLRLQQGDVCEVVAGSEVYSASVIHSGHPVRVQLLARLEGQEAGAVYQVRVGLVQAITRPALVDQVLEKGTEVGASFFLLLPHGSASQTLAESSARRMERWRRIVLEAAKQSKQVWIPELTAVESVEEALQQTRALGAASLVLDPGAAVSLESRLERPLAGVAAREAADGSAGSPQGGLAVWVGPESGWSAAELEWFEGEGLEPVRMGRSILRTETAGPVAIALSRLVLGDW